MNPKCNLIHYNTRQHARDTARILKDRGYFAAPFKCSVCGKYHLNRNRKSSLRGGGILGRSLA